LAFIPTVGRGNVGAQQDGGSETRLPLINTFVTDPAVMGSTYRRRLVATSIGIFGSLLGGYVWLKMRTASLTHEEIDICEAILRQELSDLGHDPRAKAGVCLRVRGLNPPAPLLHQLQQNQARVLAGSEFRDGSNVLVEIGPIRQSNEFTAKVFASCYVAGDVGWGRTFTMVRKDGKWIVEHVELLWVS
jgi:hypothetical protein